MHMIEVNMTPVSASSSDGAQVYWDKDGVWEEYGGIGGRRMPMDGGISGMVKTVPPGCQQTNPELSRVLRRACDQ